MSTRPPVESEDDEADDGESASRLWTASVTSAISFFRSKPLRISLSPSSSLSSCLRMNVLGLRSSKSKSLNSGPSSDRMSCLALSENSRILRMVRVTS